jgi:predicted GNAT family acetyltransferase
MVVDSGDGSGVQDNTAAARYELATDAGMAFLAYRDTSLGHRILAHTEVPRAVERRGLGTRLVVAALDDARAHDRRIVPACPFVKSYIERHKEYEDLVAR